MTTDQAEITAERPQWAEVATAWAWTGFTHEGGEPVVTAPMYEEGPPRGWNFIREILDIYAALDQDRKQELINYSKRRIKEQRTG